MARWLFFPLIPALALLALGCGNEKKEALEGVERLKAACADNDKDLAKKMAEDLRAKNKTFDKAFGAAIDDKRGSVNYCSPLLFGELTQRIEHGS